VKAKLALAFVVLGLSALAATPAARSADPIAFKCFDPSSAVIDCSGWHTTPVSLVWIPSGPVVSGCVNQTFKHDAALITASCETTTEAATVKLHIDMTPPRVTSAAPARPADYAGWWNHPVAVAFSGSDATSGIASCDTVTYSGPDGAAAVAIGACRDNAGNAGTGAFTLAYDSTPPRVVSVSQMPGDRRVMLSWRVSPDTTRVDVARTPGTAGTRPTSIYEGTAARFTDRRAGNGRTYRYTVTAFDAAGNADSASLRATPSALLPRAGSRVRKSPFLRWHAIAHARYYNVQVFRGSRKVLSAWPTRPGLHLHRAWSFNGHRYKLRRGSYRWYVWPGFGSRSAHRYGALIGRSSFRFV
jgi:hypothetical protein